MRMDAIDQYLNDNRDRFEAELIELLRIPSISADSRFVPDIQRAAQFVADKLQSAGIPATIIPTAGHPIVYGEWLNAGPDAPTILLYGHYDVQPPDPLDLWITGPFEPTVRDGNLYARGATDDKGQMYTHIKAIEAWMQSKGSLPLNVKVIIEGEEEVGGHAIETYLQGHAEQLACDYVVISDTSMLDYDRPSITCGLRGITYFEVHCIGANRDLHSGSFGGTVPNPANALGQLIASLHDNLGRIRLPGFYDDVVELSTEMRQSIAAVPFDEDEYRQTLGCIELVGEAGYTTLERKGVRPTCDVNGIFGGYQGEGAKTVIPCRAGCKVSFRLVPKQDPVKIEAAFREHLRQHCPPGIQLEIKSFQGSAAITTPFDGPGIRAAVRALDTAFGTVPVFMYEGGSIPIVASFKNYLGADALLLGFGLPDDNTHAPNEKFRLVDYHRGIRTMAHLFSELVNEASKK